MKKLLLLSLLFVAFAANSVFAQVPRKVLVEEFTNTGCPPCALSDPWMLDFEHQNPQSITVLKFHTQGPDPNDPYYIANTTDANPRADYYSVPGVPHVRMDGYKDVDILKGPAAIQAALDDVLASDETSPFELTIDETKTADSIIAVVTVKAVGTVPSETDMSVACVFAEKFDKFTGSNGMTYYDYIVRKTLPGINQSTGAITVNAKYPVLTIAMGETKTFRYAAKIGSTWQKDQLYTVAFIQAAGSKNVYQSNWTVPNVTIEQSGLQALMIPSDKPLTYKVTNNSAAPVTLNTTYTGTGIPADWNIAISGVGTDGSLVVPANGNATISVASTAASNMTGSKPFSVAFSFGEGLYIDEVKGLAWGKNNNDIVVDAGAGTTNTNTVATAVKGSGAEYTNSTVTVTRADFESAFESWKGFRTVLYVAGTTVGLFSDVGSWEKLDEYLADGGHYLLSSTVCLTAYFNSNSDNLYELWRTNFGIDPTAYDNSQGWGELNGVAGDALSDGISTTVSSITTTHDLTAGDGTPCFKNENDQIVGMRHVVGTGKTVYLTFGLNNVKSTDRSATTKKIMDWFSGASSVKTSENATTVAISNYPNPAATTTTFKYSLTERSLVTLIVYDVMGREVASIVTNEMQDKGTYKSDLDVSKLATGSYIYKMNVGGKMLSGTLNVVK